MANEEKPLMVVGIDESEHSFYALEWTLDHLIIPSLQQPPFKLLILHVTPSPLTTLGLAGPAGTAAVVIPFEHVDVKNMAARVLDKARDICTAKSVSDVTLEAVEGDARNVLCEVVEKYHASMLVIGSHGHGAIRRAVLGSVSDYCAHHAHCTVMIVKKPKIKH